MSKLTEHIDRLRVLQAKQIKCLEELDFALTLKEFYPEAFEHGKVRGYVLGPQPVVYAGTHRRDGAGIKLVIEHPDVKKKVEFAASDVPVVILRRYMKEDIRWYLPRLKQQHERKFNDAAQPLCKYANCKCLALEGTDHCDLHDDANPLRDWWA